MPCSWWNAWTAYTGYGREAEQPEAAPHPGAIDNSGLFSTAQQAATDGPLKEDLQEERDYVIVTAQSWEVLARWFSGGPAIKRTAMTEGLGPHTKRARVMLHPMSLEVCYSGEQGSKWIQIDHTVRSGGVAHQGPRGGGMHAPGSAAAVLHDTGRHVLACRALQQGCCNSSLHPTAALWTARQQQQPWQLPCWLCPLPSE